MPPPLAQPQQDKKRVVVFDVIHVEFYATTVAFPLGQKQPVTAGRGGRAYV